MKRISLLLCVVLCAAELNQQTEQKLWQYRNLGKAFYENPTTQVQAIDVFKKALDLNPSSVREQVNYALALMRGGKTNEGVAALIKVQAKDPKLPHTWFNLGIYYRKNGDFEKATRQFEEMTRLVPDEPKSHYNLGVLYKQEGRMEDAEKQFKTATALDPNLAAPYFQLYNVYRQGGKREQAMAELQTFQKLKKAQEGAAIPEDMEWSDYAEIWDPIDMKPEAAPATPTYELRTLAKDLDPKTAGMLLLDTDGTGSTDLLVWSAKGISIFRKGSELVKDTGLGDLTGVVSVASGDFDNDGLPDLCVLTEKQPLLYRNVKGRFEPVKASLPEGRFEKAVWIDYDHDYDLDLFLLGTDSKLMRNQGESGFLDRTADYPFGKGQAVDAALTRVMADSKAFDLVVSYADHPGMVYLDKLGEHFEAKPVEALTPGARWLKPADVNHDSWLDLIYDGGVLLNQRGQFVASSEKATDARAVQSDFDGDGRIDEARITESGTLELAMNRTPAKQNWVTVQLVGIKNLKLAYAAEVEVKAGELYDKKIYDGVPLTFDLRGHDKADTVRITWANGLIQNETNQAAGKAYVYREEQRLSGSCPMIWSWDGKKFRFVTDVLGVAPLGASSGDGKYFPVDHDEFVQIPGDALNAENGKYEIRVTEELSEVSYLDQIRLIAVDHPSAVDIFTNDKWKSPPFPEFRLFGSRQRVYPVSARDDQGRDVRDAVLRRDGTYPSTFKRNLNGVADMHSLTLDFGKAAADNRAVLVLNGWVDWADGSTFLAAAQEMKQGLVTPQLQVRDAQGRWVTVIEDMGMPSGKPKTMAVDLTGKFLSKSREVRIVTNVCVYWDEIFLIENSAPPPAVLTRVPAITSDLHFRGFSQPVISAARTQPESFLYDIVRTSSSWNPTPGMYTRYGDVGELLTGVDDKYVIMGSGDEIRLVFDAKSLPPVRQGWKREFLLKVDGWAKDRDANTAFSQSVGPLPFHAMSRYPYPASERFPMDAEHRAWMRKYNTRPALTLIRPLVADGAPSRSRASGGH